MPGIVQTEEYARAIFRTRFGVTEDEVEEHVAARLKRREILERDRPPVLWLIIDEAVLRRPVGTHRGLWAGGFAIADFGNAPTVGYQSWTSAA
jgi:hypothetical protein